MDVSKRFSILRYRQGFPVEKMEDDVIAEYSLHMTLNGAPYASITCSYGQLSEMTAGRLLADGYINRMDDISSVTLDEQAGSINVTLNENVNNTGAAPLPTGQTFSYSSFMHAVQRFLQNSELFEKTGSVHACAICDQAQTLFFREDIGKLNAIDKALGAALSDCIDLEKTFMIVSGRVQSKMIQKLLTARVPVLISRSAPTDCAIELARANNLTLCGFARGTRINVYAGQNRIV